MRWPTRHARTPAASSTSYGSSCVPPRRYCGGDLCSVTCTLRSSSDGCAVRSRCTVSTNTCRSPTTSPVSASGAANEVLAEALEPARTEVTTNQRHVAVKAQHDRVAPRGDKKRLVVAGERQPHIRRQVRARADHHCQLGLFVPLRWRREEHFFTIGFDNLTPARLQVVQHVRHESARALRHLRCAPRVRQQRLTREVRKARLPQRRACLTPLGGE